MVDKVPIPKRQYDILCDLEEATGWLTQTELGQRNGCSYKTIQNELTAIRSVLPHHWTIHSRRGVGLRLELPPDETISSTFIIEEHNRLSDILHLLLNGSAYTLQQLSERLFMNPNSVLSLVSLAEDHVRPFHLEIRRRPFSLKGSEGYKRLLAYDLSMKKNGIPSLYTKGNRTDGCLLNNYLTEHHGVRLTNYGLNAFLHFYEISRARVEAGFHADELPFSFGDRVRQYPFFKELDGFFGLLEELHGEPLPEKERIYVFLALMMTEFELTSANGWHTAEALKQHRDYNEFAGFLDVLSAQLNFMNRTDDLMIFHIFSIFQIAKLRSIVPELQYMHQDSVLRIFIEKNKKLYDQLEMLCNNWSALGGFPFHRTCIASLTILLAHELIQREKVNVLLIFSRSFVFSRYVKSILTDHFGGKASFRIQAVSDLPQPFHFTSDIDLIITDTDLPDYPTEDVFLVGNFLTEKDLLMIADAIERKRGLVAEV
ncbi:BglG family transcription antiterminator [Edaphobacillus lindanitolerans]|uniref:Transcriptional antiterminator, BglG family n=1 Tax=Edaphobacillus lindanitolerans TaxID=550447 RepID=A0A1U7PNA9_9BACI|nr:hypothetical protein [Edaphobacillus lindanitolerans]SIT73891.1 transcriptional antiterminator, BglG family [Edaphobacillus lindanitolerans]